MCFARLAGDLQNPKKNIFFGHRQQNVVDTWATMQRQVMLQSQHDALEWEILKASPNL